MLIEHWHHLEKPHTFISYSSMSNVSSAGPWSGGCLVSGGSEREREKDTRGRAVFHSTGWAQRTTYAFRYVLNTLSLARICWRRGWARRVLFRVNHSRRCCVWCSGLSLRDTAPSQWRNTQASSCPCTQNSCGNITRFPMFWTCRGVPLFWSF